MLEQVVQTSESALDHSAHGHLVMPAFAVWLKGDGINVIRHEAAVWAGSVAESLVQHSAKDGL